MAKIKLFPHQLKALEMTRGMNKAAYYLDMGLGKTFVATEKAEELETNIILVVCQKSKLEDWEDHFNEFYPKYKTIIYKKQLQEIQPNTVIIINYDLIWRRDEFKKLKGFTLILDESSYIKNESSNRTKFILKMKAKNIILLSGTPTGGKYEELFSQIKLLGWKITKEAYWDKYIKFFLMNLGGFKKKKVTGYKNIDDLKQMLRQYGAVFMKTEEVIELPEVIPYEIKIKNIPQYKKFKKDRLIEIEENELVGDTSLTRLLYLRQLAAMYNKNKYEKVTELLESTEDRMIIFYNFKYECQKLQEICKKLKKPISIVNGGQRDLKNYEQHDNTITLIQYQAGAMGLNLQKANKIIYFSLTLSSELFEQSKKRTHRMGQQRSCFYYYLITEKSIEEDIFETLKQRKDYTDKLFEGEI
ncbi:helicase SNF2 [Clostridium beijerinckii]|uniref:DEAD/DEAH box helicase n=1 Tax=Clostridium beijerinckii TaxID=1520 RepID=A0AB74VFP3_CLOBE|nr:DEAD/DEAH box helicase [Clostridium beijerinckii]NRZ24376.1 SNF2 family DNA or RNA helicase [Clostridium beijerinckii]NYB99405.1 SNF2 family DNA or RNA helicase [Clostridium beijerinckii]OOM21587.1 ATP-dependent RNA helicase DbpA [Clostridium beijerinckii]QUN35212.1 DEAD/DEAH box helicase [Clostridium beijerinckii]SQB20289.1 phage helicase [Clostridium beijerinckii]